MCHPRCPEAIGQILILSSVTMFVYPLQVAGKPHSVSELSILAARQGQVIFLTMRDGSTLVRFEPCELRLHHGLATFSLSDVV